MVLCYSFRQIKKKLEVIVKDWKCIGSLALAMCLLPWGMHAQTNASSPCALEPPQFSTSEPNIFNDRQEQDLGDALAEYFEANMRIAPQTDGDELKRIGERLLKVLPPTGVQYRFRIYDSGEIDAFSSAGGRVYVSRKLVAAAKSEDELAGVVAHEIGHQSTHQTAIEMTRLFKIRLGVTEVGDRADIFAKVHRFLSTPPKDNEDETKEIKDELVADHVAIYALLLAGYDTESFPNFFNRVSLNNGKTGNWLTDTFGLTRESSRRYREAMKMVGEVPPGCIGKPAPVSTAFLQWQQSVVQERVKDTAATATGDSPVKLDPPLRPSPWRIRFSPDGKTVMVQDEGSITVVSREPEKVLLQIDAPDAEPAQFTPDSSGIVFNDSNLRVEKWTVATGQRAWVRELIVYDGCSQTLLSPDGKTLACARFDFNAIPLRMGLRLIDVDSGQPYFDKPGFFQMGIYASDYDNWRVARDLIAGEKLVTMVVSLDGKYLVVAAGDHLLAYDLESRQTIALSGKLKNIGQTQMTFIGPNEMFFAGNIKGSLRQGLLVSFPDGRQLSEMEVGDQNLMGITKGEGVIAWPFKDDAVGLVDLSKGQLVGMAKLSAIDQWENLLATEDPQGGVEIGELGKHATVHIPYPVGSLPSLRAAAFSPDGKYLAFSFHNRSSVWRLDTGKQIGLLRPFRSAWIDNGDRLWAQSPKYMGDWAHKTAIDLNQQSGKQLGKFEDEDWQYHDMHFRFKPMGKDKNTRIHATLGATKMETQAVAWTRDYPHETPAIWPADDDRLVLAWDLSDDTARSEIKSYPVLQSEAQAMKTKNRGLLIETVNPETGAPEQQVLIPDVDLTHGWDDERSAIVSGGFVLAHGEQDNTVIYKLDTGAKVGEFFGMPLATDAASGLIAAANREDEILIVDERSGKELKRFTLGSPVRQAQIVPGNEATLLVLTEDQVVHRVPLGK
jgi:WD40 repeat protein